MSSRQVGIEEGAVAQGVYGDLGAGRESGATSGPVRLLVAQGALPGPYAASGWTLWARTIRRT